MAQGDDIGETAAPPADLRSVAQLNMLHSLTASHSLDDVAEIGAAITAELRTIVDYHNCRVYVLQEDGSDADPHRVPRRASPPSTGGDPRGALTAHGRGHHRVGGRAPRPRCSRPTPERSNSPSRSRTPTTSWSRCSRCRCGRRPVHGVIVCRARLREVRRGGPTPARGARLPCRDRDLNAKLLHAEREAAETSTALLDLSKQLTQLRSVGDILHEALETVSSLIGPAAVAFYVRDEHTGRFRLARLLTVDAGLDPDPARDRRRARGGRASIVFENDEPFVALPYVTAGEPPGLPPLHGPREILVAPMRWEPDGRAPSPSSAGTATRSSASMTSAYPRCRRHDVARARERTPDVRARTLPRVVQGWTPRSGRHDRRASSSPSWPARRRTCSVDAEAGRRGSYLGLPRRPPRTARRRWPDCSARSRAARGRASSTGFRATDGSATWIRDLIHVIRGRGGTRHDPAGLMVDITERKRAERALRASERKY